MNEYELKILDFIHEHLACRFLDAIMPIITKFGDGGIFWIAVALMFIIIKKTRKTGISMGTALLIGLIIGNLILKNSFARIRPYDLNTAIRPDLLVKALSDYSFPSGHTLASFEAATVLLIRDKRFGIPAVILAVLIAFSRLYLYVHYPSDVLAGAVLGTFIGFLSCKLIDKIFEKIEERRQLKTK